MAENTAIEWATHTFNPWRGCTKISPGCANCYAETLSHRNPGTLGVWGPKGTRVVAAESAWREPQKWDKAAAKAGERHRVFCASLADVFEDWRGRMSDSHFDTLFSIGGKWTSNALPDEQPVTMDDVRRRLFALIDATPNLDWLLLTKRPENALRMMVAAGLYAVENPNLPCPQRNLWLGTSVENQDAADERIPHLLRVPAAVRFLSVEPLLGPVDLSRWLEPIECDSCGPDFTPIPIDVTRTFHDGRTEEMCEMFCEECCLSDPEASSTVGGTDSKIDWVIVGGESGPNARPCRVEWIRAIVQQCRAAGVPCFVKQLGSNPEGNELWQPTGRLRRDKAGNLKAIQLARTIIDRKGGAIGEWPEDLRVREFPKAGGAS